LIIEADYDEIELQKYSYDVINITSPKNVTKIMSQKFFQFGPLPIKISGYTSVCTLYHRICKELCINSHSETNFFFSHKYQSSTHHINAELMKVGLYIALLETCLLTKASCLAHAISPQKLVERLTKSFIIIWFGNYITVFLTLGFCFAYLDHIECPAT